MQNAALASHIDEHSDKKQFVYEYFKLHAQSQLSAKAFGRLVQDLNTKNLKGFTRSYLAAEKVIKSAITMRYLVTTLSPEERLSS